MRQIWFSIVFLLGLAAAATAAPAGLNVTPQDRVLGKSDAPITVIEYASMTCPHCARFQMVVFPDIKKDWIDTGKVRWIVRPFPRDKEDLIAWMIAECAPRDRYYAFVDTLLTGQDQWMSAKPFTSGLTRFAKLGGMSQGEVQACLKEPLKDNPVQKQVAQSGFEAGKELGVDSTPTFFINGKKVSGEMDAAGFAKLLSQAGAKS